MFTGEFVFDLQRFVYIDNDEDDIMVYGGAGDDDIYNYGSYVTIDGGEGDDYIENDGSYVTIDGGEGDDYIERLQLNLDAFNFGRHSIF